MFTGIITDTGKIIRIRKKGDSVQFTVQPTIRGYLRDRQQGDSMAINGACMTITAKTNTAFEFTTVKESLSKTNLGDLKIGSYVNLEKPMKLNDRLDGHIVQGHVDTTGIVHDIKKLKDSWEYFFGIETKYYKNIIYVGSITINGISLTVADIKKQKKFLIIKIAIIPHTYRVTNFRYLKVGDKVNLEFDMLGKFVMRILENISKK